MTLVCMAPIGLDAGCWAWLDAAKTAVKHQFPGFGRPRAPKQPAMADLADEVAESYGGPLDLIGVSMGGMVALHVALRHPARVRSVLVACTGARADPLTMRSRAQAAQEKGMAAVLAPTLQRWFTPEALASGRHPGVGYATRTLLGIDPRAFADGWRAIATHDVVTRLAELSIPVTAVTGGRDAASPAARSREIAELTGNGRLVVVEDAPHMIHLECPERFSAVIKEHLSWVTGDG